MERKTSDKLIKLVEDITDDPETKTNPAMVVALARLVEVLF